MFQAGDYVVYGDNGLCLIEKVGVPDFSISDRDKTYYFLRTQEDGSRIYVPTDTRMPLRAPMTAEEAQRFLDEGPQIAVSLPERRDRKTVQAHYQGLLRDHTAQSQAQVIKSIRHQHHGASGRISGVEETLLRRAEKQLCGELASALGISEEEARGRLAAALE